ncbi:sushi, von Willebrand factor type A, EGF and pentraxin domain-containing protein 1-like [Antedon mediterranea]|uniref:sushi, von Willebrand factor type A, EGF and pentraxin domain-containing protein 1-like n=1 Tax=Antedon mediterranea TaxID=105859 RepID=UPI003AF59F33
MSIPPVFYVFVLLLFVTVISAQDCAYNETEVDRTGRRCNRESAECSDTKKCKGKRRCRCDDICGTVCIPVFRDNYCDVADLGEPTVGLSVSYSDERIRFATNATFSCSPGYKLSDESLSVRMCRGDERWSGETPTCITDVGCGEPPFVEYTVHNGTVNGKNREIYGIGERLQYTCDYGYASRKRIPYITCERDVFNSSIANWTEVDPSVPCTPVSCGFPGSVSNGRRNGNVFNFGSSVTFECYTGYVLSGRSYRVCQADAEWSGSVPVCNPIRCPFIPEPEDGYLFGTEYTYGKTIRINCNSGFVVTGTNLQLVKATCQADATWNHSPQTCEAVNCGNPGTPLNGTRNGDDFGYEGYIVFSCDDGFRIEGIASIYCEADNQWSEPLPKCIGQCILPEIPENLNLISKYIVGERVDEGTQYSISCKDGYTLNSDTNLWTCLATGLMSFNPVCTEDPCDALEVIENGAIEYSNTQNDEGLFLPGTVATYSCIVGYEVTDGDTIRTCQLGNFIREEVTCTITTCDVPQIDNGYPVDNPVTVNHDDYVIYNCDSGYTVSPSSVAYCFDKVLTPPICIEDPCSSVSPISDGEIIYSSTQDASGMFPPQTTVTYQCDEGYKISPDTSKERVCAKGEFLPENSPECLLTTCDTQSISNGKVANGTATVYHGMTVEWSCNMGYESEDELDYITCWNETFVPYLPSCTEKPCPEITENVKVVYNQGDNNGTFPPNTIANWKTTESEVVDDGISVLKVCSYTAVCSLGSFEKTKTCITTCPRFEIPHADVTYHPHSREIFSKSKRKVRCQNPYRMQDSTLKESTCLDNGEWSSETPSCVLGCIVLGPPQNGRLVSEILEGYKILDDRTIIHECFANYFLVGENKTSCMLDNAVLHQPQCVHESNYTSGKYCPILRNKEFGWYDYSDSLNEGSVVRFGCTHQYISSIPAFQRECRQDDTGRFDWYPLITEEPVCRESNCRDLEEDRATLSSSAGNSLNSWINTRHSVEFQPDSTGSEPLLQIQFNNIKAVSGVVLKSSKRAWVTLYRVEYKSEDGTWKVIKNNVGDDVKFLGNINKNMAVAQTFPQDITTDALRIYPLKSYDEIAMKIEILICQATYVIKN